jgi:hypothetical protein
VQSSRRTWWDDHPGTVRRGELHGEECHAARALHANGLGRLTLPSSTIAIQRSNPRSGASPHVRASFQDRACDIDARDKRDAIARPQTNANIPIIQGNSLERPMPRWVLARGGELLAGSGFHDENRQFHRSVISGDVAISHLLLIWADHRSSD